MSINRNKKCVLVINSANNNTCIIIGSNNPIVVTTNTIFKTNPHYAPVIHPMGCEVKIVIDPSNKVVADVPKATAAVHFSSLITEVRLW